MTEETIERPMPAALEVEQQVLAAMMLRDEAISRVALIVDRNAFYRGRHRDIWDAILALRARSVPVDLTTVADELDRRKVLDECGGRSGIADIATAVGTAANVEAHARILLDRAIRRQAIALMTRAATQFAALDTDTAELVAAVESAMGELARTGGRGKAIQTISELANQDAMRIDASEPDRRVIPTGFPTGARGAIMPLDRCLGGGFAPGELHILGGMESSGKTAFMVELAYTMSVLGGRVAFAPLEGGRGSIIRRLRTQLSGVTSSSNGYAQQDIERTKSALAGIARMKLPFVVDDMRDEHEITADRLQMHVHMMRGEYGTQVVIVDHLSMFEADPRNVTMAQADTLRKLARIAVEEDVAVILLHHLTPEYADRAAAQPTYPTLGDFQLARHALGKYPYGIHALCNPHAGTTIARSKVQIITEKRGGQEIEVGRVDWGSSPDAPKRTDWRCLKLKEGPNDWTVPYEWVARSTWFGPYPQDGGERGGR